jgi:hypothetical protein
MAPEAERLLNGTGWLPVPLRKTESAEPIDGDPARDHDTLSVERLAPSHVPLS